MYEDDWGLQTQTPMTSRITANPKALKASESMHALGRIGQPADIAAALAFFLNPANAFITGAYLNVDGGLGTVKPIQKQG
jgi:3-oxoacyl-[acyl-carrier protein] reductase